MAGKGFIYFFPNRDGRSVATAEDFVAAGFGHALSGPGVDSRQTVAGPDGLAGLLAVPTHDHASSPSPRFEAAAQVWRKGPTKKDAKGADVVAYVGMSKAKAEWPGPADLARAHVHPGNMVRLLDGNDWVVPRCHAVLEDRPPTLPRLMDVAEDGETPISRVQPAFQRLSEDAFRFWLDYWEISEAKDRLPVPEQIRIAVAAMGVNYRVGLLEIAALLGLWGQVEFGLVLRAMIDADACDEYYEKKAREAEQAGSAAPPA